MTRKWMIRKYDTDKYGEVPKECQWLATSPNVNDVANKAWRDAPMPPDEHAYCETFAEALAWADKQARTVTVVLPRVGRRNFVTTGHATSQIDSYVDGDVLLQCEESEFLIYSEELEKFAHILLAIHYENERN